MSGRHRLVVLAVLSGVTALIVGLLVLRGRRGDDLRIQTAEVTVGTVARRVMVTGTLEPEKTVDVGSEVSGTIASIDADFNAAVRKGQVLARLDSSIFEGRLAEAQARVAQAQAERTRLRVVLTDARAKLARAEELAADALIPSAELDLARTTEQQASADVRAAEADIAAAQAGVIQARVNLNHTTIRSPIDGLVVARHVDVGQTITASVHAPVLFTIADLRRLQLLAEVAEGDVGGVGPGSPVTFQVESIGDQTFTGAVAAVRLQPAIEQPVATASTPGSPAPSAAGTSGAASSGTSTPSSSPQGGSSSAGAVASTGRASGSSAALTGVVTYTAVIEVDNANGAIPPGGTAIITLDGARRPNVVRIPNNALTFHPSADAFAAVNQKPPLLSSHEQPASRKLANAARKAYVWKFQNRQFVPVSVETGLADDSWTALVNGEISAGDVLVTSAVPAKHR